MRLAGPGMSPSSTAPRAASRHAQSKIRIEACIQSLRWQSIPAAKRSGIVVHHAIEGGTITEDRRHRLRTSERLSQFAISKAMR